MTDRRKYILIGSGIVVIHALLTVIFFFMILQTGLGPGDVGDPAPTPIDETISAMGRVLAITLAFPVYLLREFLFLFGWRLPGWTVWLSGIIYAFLIVFLYQRWRKNYRGKPMLPDPPSVFH